MAALTLGQKAKRVLSFLLGLRNRRALAALQSKGFRQSDMDEGWALLRKVAHVRFDAAPAEAPANVVAEIDAWENRWFAVIDATLRRSFPAVHERVMLNLSQADGPPVVLSVTTLLSRLDALRAATDAESRSAVAKLELRGVTAPVLDEVRAMLTRVTTMDALPSPAPTATEDTAAREADVEALWGYYLEWSAIARAVIRDRAVLRALGFSVRRRSEAAEADDGEEEEAPAAPEPATPLVADA